MHVHAIAEHARLAALLGALALASVAAPRGAAEPAPAAPAEAPPAPDDDAALLAELDASEVPASYPDPLEGANRGVLGFNEWLDRWLIGPVARGYGALMPDPAERAVRRVFQNAAEPVSFANHVLQLRARRANHTLLRFLANTTVGVAGLFDVATGWGLPERHADFGGTLHRYGVASGPYLVVPLLGPSTARDGLGDVIDLVFLPQTHLLPGAQQVLLGTGDGVTRREASGDALDALREQSVDFYAALRAAYYLSREGELAAASGAAALRSSAATSASKPSRSSTAPYSARRSASSETVPSR